MLEIFVWTFFVQNREYCDGNVYSGMGILCCENQSVYDYFLEWEILQW